MIAPPVRNDALVSFLCPGCQKHALDIRIALRLPPDDWSDERSLQLLRCARCGLDAIAVYECSRRGADERWHHVGYRLARDSQAQLWSDAERCPARDDVRCSCAAHRWLERRRPGDGFPMTLR